MHLSRILPTMILASVCALPGITQSQPQGGPPQGGASQSNSSSAKTLDYHPAFDAMDINHDGKISKEEWLAAGMSQFSFDHLFKMLDKNSDGYLTYEEFAQKPMFEIDLNHDGKITLEIYRSVNNAAGKKIEDGMKNGTGGSAGPGGGAPGGGAPGGGPGGPGGAPPSGGPPSGGPPQQ